MLNYTNSMHQVATYWPPDGNDGFGGLGYGAPVHVDCRWQDRAELFRDAQGREMTSSAVVYPVAPVDLGGYLFLGESVETDPRDVEGAREIRQRGMSPSLDASHVLWKVWL